MDFIIAGEHFWFGQKRERCYFLLSYCTNDEESKIGEMEFFSTFLLP